MDTSLNRGYANTSERGFLNDSLKRTDKDLLDAKIANMQGANFGGGDVLSQALANRLQNAYAGQLSDVQNRFARQNPIQAAQLDSTANKMMTQNYALELQREAEEKAREEARRARKRGTIKGIASLAGAIGGAAIPGGGPTGAMIGGGLGGLLAGGE